MHSTNLINPFEYQTYKSWRIWLTASSCLVILSIILMTCLTMWSYVALSYLRKENSLLNIHAGIISNHKHVLQTQRKINKKLKMLQQWSKPYFFDKHFSTVSELIPIDCKFTNIIFDKKIFNAQGQTKNKDSLHDFIQALEKTHLFQEVAITELNPAQLNNDKKLLVNFIIRGRLII